MSSEFQGHNKCVDCVNADNFNMLIWCMTQSKEVDQLEDLTE